MPGRRAVLCGPREQFTGHRVFCRSRGSILLRIQDAVSSAPSAGRALPWRPGVFLSSRWGALLSCLCLIFSLPRPPALPDSSSRNKSPCPSSSLALSQLSPQGGEVEVKSPLELPRAAARGLGLAAAWSSQTTAHSTCPGAGLGLACDAGCNTSFSAGFPFYQIKSAWCLF